MDLEDTAIWQDDPKILQDSEWSSLSANFTNAGYREGITAGKESALQQGFDEGFAGVGAPLGRELGILRGVASALLSFLTLPVNQSERQDSIAEVREIASQLGDFRLSDIAPPDLEAERHAREHLDTYGGGDEDDDEMELNDELKEKMAVETLEDLMVQMSAGDSTTEAVKRPNAEDMHRLKSRLLSLCEELKLSVQWC